MRITKTLILSLVLVLLPSLCWAWSGKVVGISDGDTIRVLRDQEHVKIRLYGIDAPEKGQAYGKKAKQFTSKMVFGKVVEVEVMDHDRYGQTVALVAVNKQILNEELLKAGYAWVYYQYCQEMICHAWADYQFAAKLDKRGLWRDPAPIPPWEFGRKKRK
ncbi:MAG: thermonuclease family protein [Deltaproteobacteria bacterium]|nr:MAG: thermonuclease family protein [Deltaproteobacteria bacterium]